MADWILLLLWLGIDGVFLELINNSMVSGHVSVNKLTPQDLHHLMNMIFTETWQQINDKLKYLSLCVCLCVW